MNRNPANSLEHTVSNECIGSIVTGLSVDPSDVILAIGGSGDAAFALLEGASRVITVDYNSQQIDYISERMRSLRDSDFDGFLRVSKEGTKDANLGERSFEKSLERRNRYFRQGKRLEKIRGRLGNLELVKGDIFQVTRDRTGFNKLYLSNAIGHRLNHDSRKGEQYTETSKVVSQVSQNLPPHGLVYVSDHEELTSLFRFWSGLPKLSSLALREDILPPELKLERELTSRAQKEDRGIWVPAVYIKIQSQTASTSQ